MAQEQPAIPTNVADDVLTTARRICTHASMTRASACEKLSRVSLEPCLDPKDPSEPTKVVYPPYWDTLQGLLESIDKDLIAIDGTVERAQV